MLRLPLRLLHCGMSLGTAIYCWLHAVLASCSRLHVVRSTKLQAVGGRDKVQRCMAGLTVASADTSSHGSSDSWKRQAVGGG